MSGGSAVPGYLAIPTRSAVSSADNLDRRCQAGLEATARTLSAEADVGADRGAA
jgi:hypothetical protein